MHTCRGGMVKSQPPVGEVGEVGDTEDGGSGGAEVEQAPWKRSSSQCGLQTA